MASAILTGRAAAEWRLAHEARAWPGRLPVPGAGGVREAVRPTRPASEVRQDRRPHRGVPRGCAQPSLRVDGPWPRSVIGAESDPRTSSTDSPPTRAAASAEREGNGDGIARDARARQRQGIG